MPLDPAIRNGIFFFNVILLVGCVHFRDFFLGGGLFSDYGGIASIALEVRDYFKSRFGSVCFFLIEVTGRHIKVFYYYYYYFQMIADLISIRRP